MKDKQRTGTAICFAVVRTAAHGKVSSRVSYKLKLVFPRLHGVETGCLFFVQNSYLDHTIKSASNQKSKHAGGGIIHSSRPCLRAGRLVISKT